METICRHWWSSQVDDKCTLFYVFCSCITGPDIFRYDAKMKLR